MTDPLTQRARHADAYWQPPSRSLTGGCVLLIGIGLFLFMFGRLGHPHTFEPLTVLWVVVAVAIPYGAGQVFARPTGPGGSGVAGADPGFAGPVEGGPSIVLGGSDIDRIRQLLSGKFPFELIPTDVHTDLDNGRLMAYALRATTPGYLADKRQSTMVSQRLQGAVSGDWLIDIDSAHDKVSVTRKKPFPKAIAPPLPSFIAASAEEATSHYDDLAIAIGIDESGQPLKYKLKVYHHWLVIGGTGSGKSVFVRGIIESFRAAGCPLLVGDGKGTDYTSLVGEAQMIMISSSPAEHVRLVHAAAEELARRRKIGEERKAAGHPDPMGFPPRVVILDEFATMRSEVASLFEEQPSKDHQFIDDLERLFKVGREFRMHMVLSTQDLYAKTIPRDILRQCKLIITLGPPSDMTLRQAFTQEMEPKARQVGELISPESQGRGLVADPEIASIKEFQSYFSYSPGMDVDNPKLPEDVRGPWRSFRDSISQRVPKLYSRQWFQVEDSDFGHLPISELNALEMVNLDLDDGQPDPEMFQYDKTHDDYNGQLRGADRPGALRELQQNRQAASTPADRPVTSQMPGAGPWAELAQPDG